MGYHTRQTIRVIRTTKLFVVATKTLEILHLCAALAGTSNSFECVATIGNDFARQTEAIFADEIGVFQNLSNRYFVVYPVLHCFASNGQFECTSCIIYAPDEGARHRQPIKYLSPEV